jgi:hypothetical protein
VASEQLGSATIRLDHVQALRFDLLPAAYCEELFKRLKTRGRFPRRICRHHPPGARRPDVVFWTFEPVPFAFASIGQVHRLTMARGWQSKSPASADSRDHARRTSTSCTRSRDCWTSCVSAAPLRDHGHTLFVIVQVTDPVARSISVSSEVLHQ